MLLFIVFIVLVYLIIRISIDPDGITNSGGRINSEGDSWSGSIRNSKAHGKGRYVFSSRGPNAGDVYEGDICYGSREGYGVYTWAKGTRYEGEWQDDDINGNGTMYYSDGKRYEGEWENGEKSGRGTMYYSDGRSYSGEWLNGKWNGQGTLRFPTGRTHTGEFRNGIHVGRGKITLPNGDEYTGEWQDPGKACGRGVWKCKNPETNFKVVKQTDDCTYEAEYQVNGKQTGRGRITYTNCVYEGEWKKYLEHGHGITKWSNGQIDEGQYENGSRVGKGKITWPDGEMFEGGWNSEGPHGYGIWKYADGTVKDGKWENGEWIGERKTRALGQKK